MSWWDRPLGWIRALGGHAAPASTVGTHENTLAHRVEHPRGEWRDVPRLQRTLADPIAPIAINDHFREGLATFVDPSFLAPLGHAVVPDAGGTVVGLASAASNPTHSVSTPASPRLAHAGLSLQRATSGHTDDHPFDTTQIGTTTHEPVTGPLDDLPTMDTASTGVSADRHLALPIAEAPPVLTTSPTSSLQRVAAPRPDAPTLGMDPGARLVDPQATSLSPRIALPTDTPVQRLDFGATPAQPATVPATTSPVPPLLSTPSLRGLPVSATPLDDSLPELAAVPAIQRQRSAAPAIPPTMPGVASPAPPGRVASTAPVMPSVVSRLPDAAHLPSDLAISGELAASELAPPGAAEHATPLVQRWATVQPPAQSTPAPTSSTPSSPGADPLRSIGSVDATPLVQRRTASRSSTASALQPSPVERGRGTATTGSPGFTEVVLPIAPLREPSASMQRIPEAAQPLTSGTPVESRTPPTPSPLPVANRTRLEAPIAAVQRRILSEGPVATQGVSFAEMFSEQPDPLGAPPHLIGQPVSTVQRQAVDDAPGTPGPSPEASHTTASGTIAPAQSAAAVPLSETANLDEIARRLYDPLAARLREELWLDRERAGLMSDV